MTRHGLDAAEPARFALLGLLLDGPAHGYDLARHFAEGTALGAIVYVGASHLYGLLGRLERDGLISGERQESGWRPPRHVYHLTSAGRTAVERWIDEPVARPRDVLLDFPLKFYLARRRDPARAAALIAQQQAQFAAHLARLDQEGAHARPDEDAAFQALLQDGRRLRTQAALQWLDHCADALAAAPIPD